MQVYISDYQALASVKLDIEGITMIVGPSNNGKSSVFRAVHSAIYNEAGSDFIKEGSSKTMVGLKFGDQGVIWTKTPKGASYNCNGEIYTKLGRSGKLPMLEDLGFRDIQTSQGKLQIQFWKQMEQPFLIMDSESFVFEMLSKVFSEDKLVPILKKMSSDLNVKGLEVEKTSAVIEELEKEQVILTSRLEKLESVVTWEDKVEKLSLLKLKMDKLLVTEFELSSLNSKISDLSGRIDILTQLMSKVDSSHCIEKMCGLVTRAEALVRLDREIGSTQRRIATLDEQIEIKQKVLKDVEPKLLKIDIDKLIKLSKYLFDLDVVDRKIKELGEGEVSLTSSKERVEKELSSFVLTSLGGVCPVCGKPDFTGLCS